MSVQFSCQGMAAVPPAAPVPKSSFVRQLLNTDDDAALFRSGGLIASVKAWRVSYLARRTERAAIMQLLGMSDRELKDIGLTRSQIKWEVRSELDYHPFTRHYTEVRFGF